MGADAYRLKRMTGASAALPVSSGAPSAGPASLHGHGNGDSQHQNEQHGDEQELEVAQDDERTDIEHGEPPDSPGTRVADDDDDDDVDDGATETAGEEERGRKGRGKGMRSKKGKGGYAGDVGDAEAGNADGAIASGVQVHPRGVGEGHRRMRNVNAQPYYAYAALANAHGEWFFSHLSPLISRFFRSFFVSFLFNFFD